MTHRSRLQIAITFILGIAATELSAQRPKAADLIARAAHAMGGAAALDSLRNKTVEFNTVVYAVGQEETHLSPARATFSFGRTLTDYAGVRQMGTTESRAVTGATARLRRVTLSTMSMVETNGALQMDGPNVSLGLGRAQSLQIEQIVRAAVHHGSGWPVLAPRTLRGELADGVQMLLGPDTVSVWFDRTSALPLASEIVTEDGVFGDRRTTTWYTRWQDAGGVKLPRQIDVDYNGRPQTHTVLTSAAVNQPIEQAQFAIPDSMVARAPRPPAAPPALTVTLVSLSPGIWRAEGGTHHSLVVEQGTGLLLVEGPQSAARTAAVLDTLRSRFSGRPVTGVVMTHHHHDHSGGIRAYQARGIRVIAHHRNVDFVKGIAAARKTKAPDALSRGRPAPPAVGVRDSLVLGSGAGRVVLYPMASAHVEGLLGVWVPSAGAVFTSDVVNPAANQPLPRLGSSELVAFARAVGIAPAKYVGGHGTLVDWPALEAAAR
ncbi:MAG: MBL fold metallo-hydrolase [Gemmatimonadales bacterium]|nr:MBL fold metallo-hydrolase [Gemmatimonadales bacterium]